MKGRISRIKVVAAVAVAVAIAVAVTLPYQIYYLALLSRVPPLYTS